MKSILVCKVLFSSHCLAFLLLSTVGMIDIASAKKVVHISLDKTIQIGQGLGSYGAFKWSPDSKKIAVYQRDVRSLAMIDVESGAVQVIPNIGLNFIRSIAWSHDGSMLALGDDKSIIIINTSSFNVIHHLKLPDPHGVRIYFGQQSIFALDDSALLINIDGSTSVNFFGYRFELRSGSAEHIFFSPYGDKKAYYDTYNRQFIIENGKITFSIRVVRLFESVSVKNVVGYVDFGRDTWPSSCIFYNMGNGTQKETVQSVDFPEGPNDSLDGSQDVYGCLYSPASSLIVTRRATPVDLTIIPTMENQTQLPFFESFDFKTHKSVARFGLEDHFESYSESALNPVYPLMATLGTGKDGRYLTFWDFQSGQQLAKLPFANPSLFQTPQFSPDGTHLAINAGINLMPIYTITKDGEDK